MANTPASTPANLDGGCAANATMPPRAMADNAMPISMVGSGYTRQVREATEGH